MAEPEQEVTQAVIGNLNVTEMNLNAVIEAVKHYHEWGDDWPTQRPHFHSGRFESCMHAPCRTVIAAYPDCVPPDRRLDIYPGADSLRRHDKVEGDSLG